MSNSIPPFPADIDRDAFGHWLSGFTDGEGCFILTMEERPSNPYPLRIAKADFAINLRGDDFAILQAVQSFWQCGLVRIQRKTPTRYTQMAQLRVRRTRHLAEIVVPHFERFPLRAKKAHDFTIWKQGVLLLHRVSMREFQRTRVAGHGPKWTTDDCDEFFALVSMLKGRRKFNADGIPPPNYEIVRRLPLFDAES